MKLMITVLAFAWLLPGCVATPPNTNSPGAEDRDARTGLCENATPPPCDPPRD